MIFNSHFILKIKRYKVRAEASEKIRISNEQTMREKNRILVSWSSFLVDDKMRLKGITDKRYFWSYFFIILIN